MKHLLLTLFTLLAISVQASPVTDMLERIDKGASKKFKFELLKNEGKEFFELDQQGQKVVIRGHNWIDVAVGVNWYLKYYCGIHITWNNPTAKLPAVLPRVAKKEKHETKMSLRYDFNYCTFSYTMAFWDWERWQQEIDWMALHGVNLPLAVVGEECVWRNMLLKLGYSKQEVNEFIAGPAFLAWWEMNNLEGWGGPLPDSWYAQQELLQKKILKRMREWGMQPVLPGYSGMVPSNAREKLGLNVRGDFSALADKPNVNQCIEIAMELGGKFYDGEIDKVELIYHHFKSAGSQVLTRKTFLPIDIESELKADHERDLTSVIATKESMEYLKQRGERQTERSEEVVKPLNDNFIVEPDMNTVLTELLPKFAHLMLYTALLDSNASEHAARMVAMQTATDNADELLRQLNLQYNKSRQQAITSELLDIVGGSVNN